MGYLRDIDFANIDAAEDGHTSEAEAEVDNTGDDDSNLTADSALAIAHLLSSCSAVVGLHPDQAAGHIAEYAVRTGKSFAVVPCCVYSSAFPRRKLADGTPVKSLPQLI